MALWGISMGTQESIMKVAIAGMVPADKRVPPLGYFIQAKAYHKFVGSALIGILCDRSVGTLVVFSIAIQFTAIPILLLGKRQTHPL